MSVTLLFALLGALVVLAFAANRLFRRTRVPDVILLLSTGLLFGPTFGLVHTSQFQPVTHAFGTLAVILILFEGGLGLDLRSTLRHFPGEFCFHSWLMFSVFSSSRSSCPGAWKSPRRQP